MNTRLQVEHPVTEGVTGLDLVRLQVEVAADQPLPFAQDAVTLNGHAIECRVYAEDPERDYLPQTGTVARLVEPDVPGLRIDGSLYPGRNDHAILRSIARESDYTRRDAG